MNSYGYIFKKKNYTCEFCHKEVQHETYEARVVWVQAKSVCPHCQHVYCIFYEPENSLHQLQDAYHDTKDDRHLTEIYKILVPYVTSLIWKHHPDIIPLLNESVDYYAKRASGFLLDPFKNNPDYRVDVSFAALLKKRIRQSFYGVGEKWDEDVSLDSLTDGFVANTEAVLSSGEYLSSLAGYQHHVDDAVFTPDSVEIIISHVMKMSSQAVTHKEFLSALMAAAAYIETGAAAAESVFSIYGNSGRGLYQKVVAVIETGLFHVASKVDRSDDKIIELEQRGHLTHA